MNSSANPSNDRCLAAADRPTIAPTPLNKPRSCLPNSISNPEPRFEGRGTRPWVLGFVRYFVWWKDLSNKRLLYAIHAVSMGSWLRLQGGVPLRVWDRLGVTAQEDTLLIRTPVCIGLNLSHAQKRLLGKRSLNLEPRLLSKLLSRIRHFTFGVGVLSYWYSWKSGCW